MLIPYFIHRCMDTVGRGTYSFHCLDKGIMIFSTNSTGKPIVYLKAAHK